MPGAGVELDRENASPATGAADAGSGGSAGAVDAARGRLLQRGAGALTDLELLTLLLAGRTQPGRAGGIAELLLQAGGLKGVAQRDAPALSALPGVGPLRATQLLAAVEVGRRVQRSTDPRPRLTSPKEIYAYLAPALSALPREVFHVLALSTRHVLLADVRIAEGTVSTCPVDPRAVFTAALSAGATGVVLAHNHPSGDPEPSSEDVALTRQLVEAGKLLCIRVLDHLVLGDGRFVSLLERGLLAGGLVRPRRGTWNSRGGD